MMKIINYEERYQKEVLQLIKEIIQTINRKDYTLEQVRIWSMIDEERWIKAARKKVGKIAVINQQIVGYGDIAINGYIDYLYVHKDYQGIGIAKDLLMALENIHPDKKLTVAASITARPFFESQGYQVIKQNQVFIKEVPFVNFSMEKLTNYTT